MFRSELRVAIDHHTRLPAAQFLELVATRAGLPVPRSPRVPQVVETEIRNACFRDRGVPGGIRDFPADRLAAKREAEHRMLAALCFEHGDRVAIQRDASRR